MDDLKSSCFASSGRNNNACMPVCSLLKLQRNFLLAVYATFCWKFLTRSRSPAKDASGFTPTVLEFIFQLWKTAVNAEYQNDMTIIVTGREKMLANQSLVHCYVWDFDTQLS